MKDHAILCYRHDSGELTIFRKCGEIYFVVKEAKDTVARWSKDYSSMTYVAVKIPMVKK